MYKPRILRWMAIVVIGAFVLSSAAGNADRAEAEAWAKQAEEIHRLVKEKKWAEARKPLAELAAGFSRADFSDEEVSTEAIHALSECLLDLEGKLNQIRPEQDVLLTSAVRLRLAFDALSTRTSRCGRNVTRKWCGTSGGWSGRCNREAGKRCGRRSISCSASTS